MKSILFMTLLFCLLTGSPCPASFDPGAATIARTRITPGIEHLHIVQTSPAVPQNIHVLLIDLTDPNLRFKTGLAGNTVLTREPVSQQAARYGALAAINADFGALTADWDFPQGMTVQDGEIVTSPKYRTGLGITAGNQVRIGKWMSTSPPQWSWPSEVIAQNGARRQVIHWNQACETGWVSAYSYRYNNPPKSPGNRWADAAEVLLDANGNVLSRANPAVGLDIPTGGVVLVGRGSGADWLMQNMLQGQRVTFSLQTTPDWRQYHNIVGGGPAILRDGVFIQDPKQVFDGVTDTEDFELSYKNNYYDTRQPRTLAGVTRFNETLILAVVDGRHSTRAGMTLQECASFLQYFGAWNALQFDGGGSSTMVLEGQVMNVPSDGSERRVTNSLCVFYEGPPSPTMTPTPVLPEAIVDNLDAGFQVSGSWSTGSSATDKYGPDYRYATSSSTPNRTASWTFNLAGPATMEVFAWWSQGSNRADNAPYTIAHANGNTAVRVNQRANGGQWNSLGTYDFQAGPATVTLSNDANDSVVIADAVRFLIREQAPTPTNTPIPLTPTQTHTPAPPTATMTPTPIGPDSDGDGIADFLEAGKNAGLIGKSNLYLYDSDGDGLHDGIEDINRNGMRDPGETSPIDSDSDGDGYEDGIELLLLTSNPLDPNSPETPFTDADGDLLPDSIDPNPNHPDTAGDRFLDGYKAVILGLASVPNPNQKPNLGDVDHNGFRDNADAQKTLNFFANVPQVGFDPDQTDVNRDAVIDNADAQRMLLFFAQILPQYPVR